MWGHVGTCGDCGEERCTPAWKEEGQEGEADVPRLYGELIAFHWEDFGWHVARLGATTAADANVSGLYDGRWREHHALFLADYGMRGPGSWILLSPARPASPLLDYAAGKYKKQRGDEREEMKDGKNRTQVANGE